MSRQASGLMAWLVQRATALFLALFSVYLLIHFLFDPPADHSALRAWVAEPVVSVGLLLFVSLVLIHAWIGIRDVLIDYVPLLGLRILLMMLFVFVFLASGLGAFKAIVTAGLGGGQT